MEAPDFVGQVSLLLAAYDEHKRLDTNGRMAVKRSGTEFALDGAPPFAHCHHNQLNHQHYYVMIYKRNTEIESPEIGPVLQVRHPAVDPEPLIEDDARVAVPRRRD